MTEIELQKKACRRRTEGRVRRRGAIGQHVDRARLTVNRVVQVVIAGAGIDRATRQHIVGLE